jgi:hypothetical protein
MKIGDKVLCINGKFPPMEEVELRFGVETPKAGEVYTVRELYKSSIRLEEIINPPLGYNYGKDYSEKAFYRWRFMIWNPEEEEIKNIEVAETTFIKASSTTL